MKSSPPSAPAGWARSIARDTKVGRDVALKVIPDTFALDPDRTAQRLRAAVSTCRTTCGLSAFVIASPLQAEEPKEESRTCHPSSEISQTWGWRRRPDLNRGSRFCRPLPYHLATAPTRCVLAGFYADNFRHAPGRKWSGKRDSNPRLRPWQGRTLPLSYSRSSAKSQRTTAIFR